MEKQAMNLINLYNEKGEKHGYWEYYFGNGKLSYKGSYLNGEKHGYWESYYDNGNEIQPITELTLEDIANKFGISVNNLKIKK